MKNKNNVFEGPYAVREYLTPRKEDLTPIVELPNELNPLRKKRVRIYAKLMFQNQILNFKLYPAFQMLMEAEKKGSLKDVNFFVEGSSGNTAAALAILVHVLYGKKLIAVVPKDIASGKLNMLQLLGAEIRYADSAKGGVVEARELGRQKGFLNLDQYSNEANVDAHADWTAAQVVRQLGKKRLGLYIAGLGTTATALGAKKYLKKIGSKASVVGVVVGPNRPAVPGVRTKVRLEEIAFDWEKGIDDSIVIDTKEAFKMSLRLCRYGILGGPSSGFALAGLIEFLLSHENDLGRFRNSDGEVVAVFICPDPALLYWDKYTTQLDSEDF